MAEELGGFEGSIRGSKIDASKNEPCVLQAMNLGGSILLCSIAQAPMSLMGTPSTAGRSACASSVSMHRKSNAVRSGEYARRATVRLRSGV